jgi:CheY-like chemotaxis protein
MLCPELPGVSSFNRVARRLDLSALSVLVVDDQPFFRVLLTEVLRNLGVRELSVASDGEEALDAFHMVRPEIVMTDWVMPVMDGLQLTRKLRRLPDETLRATPVIMVTGNNRKSQIEEARAAGVDEFILKPVSIKSVADRLREVIERPRPFIDTAAYKGPCRRRRSDPNFAGPYRRLDDPMEIQTDEEVDETLRSVMVMAAARIKMLMTGLNQGKMSNLRPIRNAVGEIRSIAVEMGDAHVERTSSLLARYIDSVGASDRVRPDVIQTHLNSLDVLIRTPMDQVRVRDEVVAGLERVVKKTTQAA